MSATSTEASLFAMDLAKGIEKMISTEESRAVLDQYAKIPINPATEKQLAEATKRLEAAIASGKKFCYVDQPLLQHTSEMLKSKGYDVDRHYNGTWYCNGRQEDSGFYIDIFPGASAEARRKEANEKEERTRKTLELAKLLDKGDVY